MDFTIAEIGLIASQVLLIPFARYILRQQKKEIVNDLLIVINEHYIGLENLIDRNKDNIDKLSATINHKEEIVRLKNKILAARVGDLENYLSKNNNYQAKSNLQLEDNSSTY